MQKILYIPFFLLVFSKQSLVDQTKVSGDEPLPKQIEQKVEERVKTTKKMPKGNYSIIGCLIAVFGICIGTAYLYVIHFLLQNKKAS